MASRFSLTLLHGHFSGRLERREEAGEDWKILRRGGDQMGVIRRCRLVLISKAGYPFRNCLCMGLKNESVRVKNRFGDWVWTTFCILGFGDYFWKGNYQNTPSQAEVTRSLFRISQAATRSLNFHFAFSPQGCYFDVYSLKNGFSDVQNFWNSDSSLEVHLRRRHILSMVVSRVLLSQSSLFPHFGFRRRGLGRFSFSLGSVVRGGG